MTKPTKPNKNSNRSVKALVAAASIATSLGGAAFFAATEPSLGIQPTAQPVAAAALDAVQQQPQQAITLPPLSVVPMPTLVPQPTARPVDAGSAAQAPAEAQAPAAAAEATAVPVAPVAPQLRSVTVPAPSRRAPMTTTRSSR